MPYFCFGTTKITFVVELVSASRLIYKAHCMKQIIAAFLLISFIGTAQEPEEKVSSKIEEVTVFLSGAQIHRTAKVKLNKGDNAIRLTGLSRYITNNSIQVEGQEGLTIVSVSQENNYIETTDEPSDIKIMRLELESLVNKYQIELNESEVLQAEKEMILANGEIKGTETGVDAIELLDIADYYRERLNKIDFALLEKEKTKKSLNKKIQNFNKQLKEFGYKRNQPVGEIIVKISSDRARQATINFNYMVTQAGWQPMYDVRSEDVSGPIDLTYKGNVYQRTGQEWKNVKLNLSTGNPSVSGTKPEFQTWNLSVYDNDRRGGSGKGRKSKAYATGYSLQASDDEGGSSADFTIADATGVNTEFKISLPYTIPTDGKKLAVEIQKHKLPVDYNYYAVPKLDPDAYLLAGISGWDDLYLLSGEAFVYYQGTYVGNSYLDAATTEDTLYLSLGRDNNVFVQRKKVKDFCSDAVIGSNRKTEIAMEISVKNTKKSPIRIDIEDQIPISTDKDISIDVSDTGDAIYDEESGLLVWEMTLAPGESRTVQFRYSVKRPKDTYIPNL